MRRFFDGLREKLSALLQPLGALPRRLRALLKPVRGLPQRWRELLNALSALPRRWHALLQPLSGLLFVVLCIGLLLGVVLLLWPAPPASPTQDVVVAEQALPAYTRLDSARHVVIKQRVAATGAFTDTAQVQDRLLVTALKKGEAVTQANAVAAPADAWLLTVPVSNTLQALAVGDAVRLVGDEKLSAPAVILAVAAERVDVAVDPAEAPRVAAWLAAGQRIILVRPGVR